MEFTHACMRWVRRILIKEKQRFFVNLIVAVSLIVFLPFAVSWAAQKSKTEQPISLKPKYETLTILSADSKKKPIKIKVELAVTTQERNRGLMGRTSLPVKTGMLFVFDRIERQEFWMKDTLIPLDMVFINQTGRIVKIHPDAIPQDLTPISSETPVKAALELNGGESARLGIKKGDLVQYKLFTN